MDVITVGTVLGGLFQYEQSNKGVTRFYFDHDELKYEDGSDVESDAVALYILSVGEASKIARTLQPGDMVKMIGRPFHAPYNVWEGKKTYLVQAFEANKIVRCRKDD